MLASQGHVRQEPTGKSLAHGARALAGKSLAHTARATAGKLPVHAASAIAGKGKQVSGTQIKGNCGKVLVGTCGKGDGWQVAGFIGMHGEGDGGQVASTRGEGDDRQVAGTCSKGMAGKSPAHTPRTAAEESSLACVARAMAGKSGKGNGG